MGDNTDVLADPSFRKEMMAAFIEEFEELMKLYESSLLLLSSTLGDKDKAVADLFRIYHTLKGDAGFFPEFHRFAAFTSHYCELLRPQNNRVIDPSLIPDLRLNLSRLYSVLNAIKKGNSLNAFRFDKFYPPDT